MVQTTKSFGKVASECKRCGRKQGLVRKYDIYLCRHCFREIAHDMGFEKYT
ncbi:30S ribosomal protein S14 [Methanolobus psychrotolerans]|uniref:30S ribosomal protein S14 n=1 Tax=Methanolobus psychrotolerans TaxID=1874706 RepID=UPI000B9193F2|nr:30S ribosomal protein S14 [Methanolobus psychrotolerans]